MDATSVGSPFPKTRLCEQYRPLGGEAIRRLKRERLELHPRTVLLQPRQPALGLRGVGGIHPNADTADRAIALPASRIVAVVAHPEVKGSLKLRKKALKIRH